MLYVQKYSLYLKTPVNAMLNNVFKGFCNNKCLDKN